MFNATKCLGALALFVLVSGPAIAQLGAPKPDESLGAMPKPDAQLILAAAKAASGGAAWDKLKSQHSKVTIQTGGFSGNAERWSDMTNGRSTITYTVGPVSGAAGFDGKVAWSKDESGKSHVETSEAARELAVNAAYRDQLAFWYPGRAKANISYKERAEADGAQFDVIRIVPEGGRPFELWINTETKLIERLVEREVAVARTEVYMDLRTVQGVTIPHRVRASRGDPRQDETVVVEAMEFNAPLSGVSFAQPPPPKPDYAFPAGKDAVEVPLEVIGGHLFIRVQINGKGPYRMLFDSGSLNVLMPDVARKLDLKIMTPAAAGAAGVGVVGTERLDIGGLVLTGQSFATVDLNAILRRIEGIDDIAGVIGHELLNRVPVRLDYVKSRATFYNPAAFKYAGSGVAVPVTFRGTTPKVAGTVDGLAGAFAIDVGSRGSLTLSTPFVEANDLVTRFGAKTEVIAGAGVGGPVRAVLARTGTLEFGGIVIKNPVTTLVRNGQGLLGDADLAGVIGYGVLRQFDLTFDLPHNTIWFDRNSSFGTADIHDRSGLWVERGPKGYEVVDVVAGGPAAAAGMKAGDVIVAIDGKNWSATTLANLRNVLKAAPGTKVRLKLGSGSQNVVTLRDPL